METQNYSHDITNKNIHKKKYIYIRTKDQIVNVLLDKACTTLQLVWTADQAVVPSIGPSKLEKHNLVTDRKKRI